MKRIVVGIVTVLVAAFNVLPVMAMDGPRTGFAIKHSLGADDEGRSILATNVMVRYDNPEFFVIDLPSSYQGHSVATTVETLNNGKEYTIDKTGEVYRVKSTHKSSSFEFVYKQRDVTKYVADPGENRFDWVVALPRGVSRGQLSVAVDVGKSVSPTTLKDSGVCSVNGDIGDCTASYSSDKLLFDLVGINSSDEVKLSLSFTAGTFRGYQSPSMMPGVCIYVAIGATVLIGLGIGYRILYGKQKR